MEEPSKMAPRCDVKSEGAPRAAFGTKTSKQRETVYPESPGNDNRRPGMTLLIVLTFLGVSLPCAALGGRELSAPRLPFPEHTERTMSRTADFVVVQGAELPLSLGKRISHLSLIARTRGEIGPVPFQVDEIDSHGEWVLPETPPHAGTARETTAEDHPSGRLDENDQLVFMIRDAGERIPAAELPADALTVEEITLKDPRDHGLAWVYLCSFPAPPPLSEANYVRYRFAENRVVTSGYELGFSREVPISWDHLSFLGLPNMIDRLKLRFEVKVFGIPYRRNETHFRSDLSSYKDGPVRVIRRVRSSVQINRLLRTPSAASESIYYDNAIVVPFRAQVPVSLRSLRGIISDMSTRGGACMQNLRGWRVRVETDPRWLLVDGKMDETEKTVRGEGASWFLLAGPPGAFLCRVILDRYWDGSPQELPVTTDFYYVDDDLTPDPPEFVPGQSPNLGFHFHGMDELEKGVFYFYIVGYMIKDYEPGVEQDYLDIMDQPVRRIVVSVRD